MKIQKFPGQAPPSAAKDPTKPSAGTRAVEITNEVLGAVFEFNNQLSALPKFIYPTLTGTPEAKTLFSQALDSVPMHHAVKPTSLTLVEGFESENTLGRNMSWLGRIQVRAMDDAGAFKNTTVHEIGHSVDHPNGGFGIAFKTRPSDSAPFGQGPHVSDYATTNNREDFAESYELYRQNPEALKAINPQKSETMEKLDQPHFLERLVDRPAYRETGKWIAQQFEGAPEVRTGLEILRQASIVTLSLNGVASIATGTVALNGRQVASGMLQSATAAALVMTPQQPWLGVAAAAAMGADRGLHIATRQGAGAARTAAASLGAAVGGAVGGFAGPLAAVQLGHTLAGPVGGAVGLVLGGLVGGRLGAHLGARAALALTEEDTART